MSGMPPDVACTLDAAELTDQTARWERLIRQAVVTRTKTDAGVRLEFRDEQDVESELRALVAAEAACCAWASWLVSREAGTLVLRVSATGDGIAALHGLFGRALP